MDAGVAENEERTLGGGVFAIRFLFKPPHFAALAVATSQGATAVTRGLIEVMRLIQRERGQPQRI